jgi:hypothetical protein
MLLCSTVHCLLYCGHCSCVELELVVVVVVVGAMDRQLPCWIYWPCHTV